MTTLTQMARNKKEQARAAFIDAASVDEPFDRLAELAREAGMEPGEADKIIGRIAGARDDMKAAGDVVRLRRAATRAKAHADATRTRCDAAIEKLEAETEAAAQDADAAQRELNTAESAGQRVLAVYDDGLLPASRLPKEVMALIDRREQEGKVNRAHAAMIAATNERNLAREEVERIGRQLQSLSISRDRKEKEARLNEELESAKTVLATAETRLADADRAHAKARKGL
ncbi:MAG: hypothetical protein IT437_10895 [Phycisphaerales bacterium]|nr:hypothetical protein [Phycisphaerales bacterium]